MSDMRKSQSTEKSECPGNAYLDLSLLQTGDVILTFPPGDPLDATGIALATRGEYSHAILVLSPTIWFESEDFGVGPTYVAADRIEADSGVVRFLKCRDHWGKITVLRHPGLTSRPSHEVSKKLTEITDRVSFKRYPSFVRIAHDLNILNSVPLRDHLLRLADRSSLSFDINSGFFCSEVVAYAYSELGLSFKDRKPEQVTPSDIATYEVSGMTEQNLFCSRNENAHVQDASLHNAIADLNSRERFVGRLTNIKTYSATIEYIAQQAKQSAIEMGISPERLTPEGFPQTFAETLESLFHLSQAVLELAEVVGRLVNVRPNDPSALRDGGRQLEQATEYFESSKAVLRDLAATYSKLIKPKAVLHEHWKPFLDDIFEYFDQVNQEHITIASRLHEAFAAALNKELSSSVRKALQTFVQKLSQTIQALIDLKEARLEETA